MTEPKAPLAGITVLDFSRILAGPYCTMLLGDLGAEIIKIEPPAGDDCRHWGPPFVEGESAYFIAVNRNKKSLCLDLKKPEGKEVVRRLLDHADVLVENFRPGTMDRLELGYEQLETTYPRLVYCSISGYGQTGPLRDRPGYDAVMQGEGGWMSLTGEPDGMPMKVGASLADIFTGMMASEGVLAALFNRERSGRGERIDVALFDSVLATLCYQAQGFLLTGELPKRLGNRHSSLTPYETFRTSDGHVIVGVGNDALWKRFCATVERADLDRPDFERNADRVSRHAELMGLLEPLFLTKTTAEWVALMEGAGIPVGRVRNVADVFANPQIAPRHMRLELEHQTLGSISVAGNPIKLTHAGERAHAAPPVLGADNARVLRDKLGLGDDEIERLQRSGVLRG